MMILSPKKCFSDMLLLHVIWTYFIFSCGLDLNRLYDLSCISWPRAAFGFLMVCTLGLIFRTYHSLCIDYYRRCIPIF